MALDNIITHAEAAGLDCYIHRGLPRRVSITYRQHDKEWGDYSNISIGCFTDDDNEESTAIHLINITRKMLQQSA